MLNIGFADVKYCTLCNVVVKIIRNGVFYTLHSLPSSVADGGGCHEVTGGSAADVLSAGQR